jgi:hypothetical protein
MKLLPSSSMTWGGAQVILELAAAPDPLPPAAPLALRPPGMVRHLPLRHIVCLLRDRAQ